MAEDRKSLVHVIFSRFFVDYSTKRRGNRTERGRAGAGAPVLHEGVRVIGIGTQGRGGEGEKMYQVVSAPRDPRSFCIIDIYLLYNLNL